MPKFSIGDMWDAFAAADLFLITTNSTLTRQNKLVMGRGIARQAKERYPGLDLALGQQIQMACGNLGFYGLLISMRWPKAKLGGFQVKYHWQNAADLNLIAKSTTALKWWARYHYDCQIHLNFPGIGNGGLEKTAVLPILTQLPDNVTVRWALAATSLTRRSQIVWPLFYFPTNLPIKWMRLLINVSWKRPMPFAANWATGKW